MNIRIYQRFVHLYQFYYDVQDIMGYSGYARYLKCPYNGHHEYQLQAGLGSIQHIFDGGWCLC